MAVTLYQVKSAQPDWFSLSNKKFFGDKKYMVYNINGKVYLVRYTQAWTDMFGEKPTTHLRVNDINPVTLKIGNLHDKVFHSLSQVKSYLRGL